LLARGVVAVGVVAGTPACEDTIGPERQDSLALEVDFTSGGAQGWVAAFTDYQTGQDGIYEFESGIRALPAPLDTAQQAFMLSSMNRSDDMFQYIRRQVAGLVPNAEYEVRFRVQLATNAASGCVGVGGAPGESVWLKAGASHVEPKPVTREGDVRLSVDKGEQASEGAAALILGDMANSSDACYNAPYELKDFDSEPRALRARTDGRGRIWLFAGTESGFESRTRIYITRMRADLQRVN
jgi:hypothetical protein